MRGAKFICSAKSFAQRVVGAWNALPGVVVVEADMIMKFETFE